MTIDELQSSESNNQLAAKRAERELRAEQERAAQLEREIESWKAMQTSLNKSATMRSSGWRSSPAPQALPPASSSNGLPPAYSAEWSNESSATGAGIDIPQRKSSLSRSMSLTKGFL